ncbi:MAG: hypothetical protein U0354_20390 [Candidatus Sericytochromatia bacterium]
MLEITNNIDGLFSSEAHKNFKLNENIYDDLFKKGLLLFHRDFFTWSEFKLLDILSV